MTKAKTLVVYFSKTNEQYGVGYIEKGNTAILAEMIADYTQADLFEVKLQNDTYPTTYKELTEVALAEKKANLRPAISGHIDNFSAYDTVFIGTPNWWADLPMALYTFIESYDWKDKTVIPFVTHEGSGMSSIPEKIKKAAQPKAMLDGFEIYGHIPQNTPDEARQKVINWLQKSGY